MSVFDADTGDHTTVTRAGAGGMDAMRVLSAMSRMSDDMLVSSVTELCDMTSVVRVGMATLAMRRQFVMSRVINDVNDEGTDDNLVLAALSTTRPALYEVGTCVMFVHPFALSSMRDTRRFPGGSVDKALNEIVRDWMLLSAAT